MVRYPDVNARLYYDLAYIRKVEEAIAEVYPSDKIKSPVHLAIGQEFICSAVIDHLKESDYACGTYRGHGVYLAKGGNLNAMMAETIWKGNGVCKRKSWFHALS
ncbi:hypothetical protein KQ246_01865 [Pseudoalteromonas shioyasakiensis]|nr:hypothetical protein KQ246_01865 [Pseudoalteromonas shioyasakiensis]